MRSIQNLTIRPEGFVFDPSGGEMYTVNPTGLRILAGLREQKKLSVIALELSDAFGVELEQVEKDIFDFKCQLKAFLLLKNVEM